MCGISGIYNYARNDRVDEALLRRMCDSIRHRGPDDEGLYCKGNIGLGHRRLSIIDLGGGHQPMANEDRTVWIVFNGEIYNFPELREELLLKGHRFATKSDTETIIHLYEEEGDRCIDRINGMFAFAIWDEKTRRLLLARDRVGKKPLNYTDAGGRLVFASEIKAILQDSSVRRQVDREALHDYLSVMYVPQPNTMFSGIKKLPAGHYMVCDPDGVRIKKYWDIEFSGDAKGGEVEISQEVYSRLKESTRIRMISDVPLGAFLSGGVDSSSVVSLMSEIDNKPVITNSIGFSVASYDELEFARLIAKRYGTDHHEYTVEPKALDVIDKLVGFYDEPFGDASSIPTYYVSQMARRNVTVALSGDGGDENFAGYNRYMYSDFVIKAQNIIPGFVKTMARSSSAAMLSPRDSGWKTNLRNKLEELYISPSDLYFKIVSTYKEDEKKFLYSDSALKAASGYNTGDKFRKIFDACGSDSYISKLQYLDIKTYLVDDILVKVDRASMANSLEVRAPILDYKFMEFAATIPSSLKARGVKGKYIFKKAMEHNVPRQILDRAKMGFGVPMSKWLKGELRDSVENELFGPGNITGEFFNVEQVRRIWNMTLKSQPGIFRKTDLSYRIWILFLFSKWFKRYIKNG